MIFALHNIMKKYKKKNIYIWNVNLDSMNLFRLAALKRINIQGFVTLQREYVGEMYMNRPVVHYNQIEQDKDAIILVSNEAKRYTGCPLTDNKVIYWQDALEIEEELKHKKIIIYGTGRGAEKISKELEEKKIDIEMYCVTANEHPVQYNGKQVISISELEKYEDYAVIISVVIAQYERDIVEALCDFQGYIYTDLKGFMVGSEWTGHLIRLIQDIDFAIKRDRKIYLYSKKNQIAELIKDVLHIYGIELSGYVYDVEDKEHNIESIFDIAYNGVDNKFIIINEEEWECIFWARENIELAGFSLENGNYASNQLYVYSKEKMFDWKQCYDSLVGNSVLYEKGRAGWRVYGKEEDDRIKILVLGGSTSSEQYHPENWISRLYYKLRKENVKAVIYNGAYPSDDITDEMLKVLRDGYVLKPQIVISMSGVNNIANKECENQFNDIRIIDWVKMFSGDRAYCGGVHSDEPQYSFWNRNIKLLKIISEFFGAKYFGFLQPMNMGMKHMTLREKSLYEGEEYAAAARDFEEAVSGDSRRGYINLLKLFEHQDEMYLDICHYTGKGHEMIANSVYEAIIPTVRQLQSEKI